MRRLSFIIVSAILAVFFCTAPVFAARPLTMQINGTVVTVPADVHIVEGQVMLPLRWAAKQLGARSVHWDVKTGEILIETNNTYYAMAKLSSYHYGLSPRAAESEAEIFPLPVKAKEVNLPPIHERKLVLDFARDIQKPDGKQHPIPPSSCITITVNETQLYAVYSFETHHGHVYVPMDWLEVFFFADVNYNQAANQLCIQAPNQALIEKQIAVIEDAIMPATPEEAMHLWGRGEQIRCGALQYAALAPQLRRQVDDCFSKTGWRWVTGYSSPWMGLITVAETKKLSDTAIEYTITYPEITSVPPPTTATEKFVVEKLTVNGKVGWFITKLLIPSNYGIL